MLFYVYKNIKYIIIELKEIQKKLFVRNFFSKSKNGHNMGNVHFTFSISTFCKKSEKMLMLRNALNEISKFSIMLTTFFFENEKVKNKKIRPRQIFFYKKFFFSKFLFFNCVISHFKKKRSRNLQQKNFVYKTITLLMQRAKSNFPVFQYK